VVSTTANGTRTFNFNGGSLTATGDTAAFFNLNTGTSRANVRNGGAVINTNGFNVTVAQALLHSNIGGDNAIDGGLTKQGAGALILSGGNTFNGNTFVDDGSFSLANGGSMMFKVFDASNTQIFGDASNALATFDGQFRLDLSSVTVNNGSWLLVNGANLTETFGGTFTVADNAALLTFAQSNDVWTAVDGEKTWTFTEATGLLQVVPEPGSFALLFGGIGMLVMFRRRR
jgi:autotransporter-associated beta strand protein